MGRRQTQSNQLIRMGIGGWLEHATVRADCGEGDGGAASHGNASGSIAAPRSNAEQTPRLQGHGKLRCAINERAMHACKKASVKYPQLQVQCVMWPAKRMT